MNQIHPNPPECLLARCLDTIPAKARNVPAAPRLFPDAGSRARLRWLSLAAAVPVITVLLVIPWKRWNNSHAAVSALEQSTNASTLQYVRLQNTDFPVEYDLPDGTRFSRTLLHTVTLFDQKRGMVVFPVKEDFVTPLARSETPALAPFSLTTTEGIWYYRTGRRLIVRHSGKAGWNEVVKSWQDTSTEAMSSFAPPTSDRAASVARRQGKWRDTPVSILEVTTTPGTAAQQKARGGTSKKTIVYVDVRTHLTLASESYIFWKQGPNKNRGLVRVSVSERFYDPRPGEERYFDVARFKQGW